MREVTSHKVNGLNDGLKIQVFDEPGSGGANHRYHITTVENPPAIGGGMGSEALQKAMAMSKAVTDIHFQNGPIKEAGINGISNEALLAIVKDRMEGFQRGQFSCRENALALTKIDEAIMWLLQRTRERVQRGVEGTLNK